MAYANVLVSNKTELQYLIATGILTTDYGYFSINSKKFPTVIRLCHSHLSGMQSHCPCNDLSKYKIFTKHLLSVYAYTATKHAIELIKINKQGYVTC